MTTTEQKRAAKAFVAKWSGKGYEKGECQEFWNTLLRDVFGIGKPEEWIRYPELLKAHESNDAAVLAAYGFDKKLSESEIVAKLFEKYTKLTKK